MVKFRPFTFQKNQKQKQNRECYALYRYILASPGACGTYSLEKTNKLTKKTQQSWLLTPIKMTVEPLTSFFTQICVPIISTSQLCIYIYIYIKVCYILIHLIMQIILSWQAEPVTTFLKEKTGTPSVPREHLCDANILVPKRKQGLSHALKTSEKCWKLLGLANLWRHYKNYNFGLWDRGYGEG